MLRLSLREMEYSLFQLNWTLKGLQFAKVIPWIYRLRTCSTYLQNIFQLMVTRALRLSQERDYTYILFGCVMSEGSFIFW